MPWFIECKQRGNELHEQFFDLALGINELVAEIKKFPEYEITKSSFGRVEVRHRNGRVLLIRHALEGNNLKEVMDSTVGAKKTQ